MVTVENLLVMFSTISIWNIPFKYSGQCWSLPLEQMKVNQESDWLRYIYWKAQLPQKLTAIYMS